MTHLVVAHHQDEAPRRGLEGDPVRFFKTSNLHPSLVASANSTEGQGALARIKTMEGKFLDSIANLGLPG